MFLYYINIKKKFLLPVLIFSGGNKLEVFTVKLQ